MRKGLYFGREGIPRAYAIDKNENGIYEFSKFKDLPEELKKKVLKHSRNQDVYTLLEDFLNLHLSNFHNIDYQDRSAFIKANFDEDDFSALELFCLKHKLIDGFGITEKGIEVLSILNNRENAKRQDNTNFLMLAVVTVSTLISFSAILPESFKWILPIAVVFALIVLVVARSYL
jgi:hypothetical protein